MYSRKTSFLAMGLCACFALKAQPVQHFDIIIEEIFADPSPPKGLPNSEYVEIRNRSRATISLLGWSLTDGSSRAFIRDTVVLKPDSFLILCPRSAASEFAAYGACAGLSNFPSLNNDGDLLQLISAGGRLVHAVQYAADWYRNPIKADGGWSLEMIDTDYPCQGASNWEASRDPAGGTPGRINSVHAANPDDQPPALLYTYTVDSLHIIAVFDEPLDSLVASEISHYKLKGGAIAVVSAVPQLPLFDRIHLELSSALLPQTVYILETEGLSDCSGHTIGALNSAKSGLPLAMEEKDLLFNELLFNPPSGGADYIELYNRSQKICNLADLFLANGQAGTYSNIQPLNAEPALLFPGEFLVLTTDPTWVRQQYLVRNLSQLRKRPALPSMPDTRGSLVLVRTDGLVIDEIQYDHGWHFPLIHNEEGVSLERILYDGSTQDPANWTSAAASSGYGTPTYLNSHAGSPVAGRAQVSIEPAIISPDNDGRDDYALIHYAFDEPGYVLRITIYDAGGQLVRQLMPGQTIGPSGSFRWDGLDDRGRPLASGPYLILTQAFNLQGRVLKFKNSIILARKF